MLDLMSAAQEAFFTALAAAIPPGTASVHDHLKQGTQPPFVHVGGIDEENVGSKGEQGSRFEVEVHSVYKGADRSELLAIMHQVRLALDGQPIAAAGVEFSTPAFIGAAASMAGHDGLTYAGISTFEVFAEPM